MAVALDFNFMGGSMGAAVGEGFLEAAREAIKLDIPLVIFTLLVVPECKKEFFINATS